MNEENQEVPVCPWCRTELHPLASVCHACGAAERVSAGDFWGALLFVWLPWFLAGPIMFFIFFGHARGRLEDWAAGLALFAWTWLTFRLARWLSRKILTPKWYR